MQECAITVEIFKISLFAMDNVGKETLLTNYFKDRYFEHNMVSIGVVWPYKDLEINGRLVKCFIWVCSSKKHFRQLYSSYLKGSNGVILMYDITNRETLSNLSEECQKIKNCLDYDIPKLLVGNKFDLDKNRDVSEAEVENFKKENEISASIEISLKTGENVEVMFTKMAKMILTHHRI
jgi:small GTP-binding protein